MTDPLKLREPDPLVPADVDLRGLPWMPVDTVRLLDSDINAISSGDEFRAAVRLWCKAWHQVPAGSLPDDDRILATLSGYGVRWKRMREVALRGFVRCSDGRLYHPVIAEKALEAWAHRKAQRDRAAKRWHSPGNATASPGAHATASPAAMQGTGQGQDKKPRAERSRGSRLPADWTPSEEQLDFCRAERPDLDPAATAARFRDFWIAKPGAGGVKLDWNATWRNWIRSEKGGTGKVAEMPKREPPCGNCGTALTGGWTNSEKGRVCQPCWNGYMAGQWPSRKAA